MYRTEPQSTPECTHQCIVWSGGGIPVLVLSSPSSSCPLGFLVCLSFSIYFDVYLCPLLLLSSDTVSVKYPSAESEELAFLFFCTSSSVVDCNGRRNPKHGHYKVVSFFTVFLRLKKSFCLWTVVSKLIEL